MVTGVHYPACITTTVTVPDVKGTPAVRPVRKAMDLSEIARPPQGLHCDTAVADFADVLMETS